MRRKRGLSLAALPLYVWTVLMVLFPLGYVLALSFATKGETFGVEWKLTLDNYIRMASPLYGGIFASSFLIALLTTALTLLIGYPFARAMVSQPPARRALIMMLVIIPFWTSALMRTYGWMILLRNKGVINTALKGIGIIAKPLKMLNTRGAVIAGMTYSFLPFMILPIYSSLEKLDASLGEAARDLGANPLKAFFTVELPLTAPGMLSGCTLVFVPSMGAYFISDLLGGGNGMLLGNLINNQLTVSRDWPFGAALSAVMIALTFLTLGLMRRVSGGDASLEVF